MRPTSCPSGLAHITSKLGARFPGGPTSGAAGRSSESRWWTRGFGRTPGAVVHAACGDQQERHPKWSPSGQVTHEIGQVSGPSGRREGELLSESSGIRRPSPSRNVSVPSGRSRRATTPSAARQRRSSPRPDSWDPIADVKIARGEDGSSVRLPASWSRSRVPAGLARGSGRGRRSRRLGGRGALPRGGGCRSRLVVPIDEATILRSAGERAAVTIRTARSDPVRASRGRFAARLKAPVMGVDSPTEFVRTRATRSVRPRKAGSDPRGCGARSPVRRDHTRGSESVSMCAPARAQ